MSLLLPKPTSCVHKVRFSVCRPGVPTRLKSECPFAFLRRSVHSLFVWSGYLPRLQPEGSLSVVRLKNHYDNPPYNLLYEKQHQKKRRNPKKLVELFVRSFYRQQKNLSLKKSRENMTENGGLINNEEKTQFMKEDEKNIVREKKNKAKLPEGWRRRRNSNRIQNEQTGQ